MAFELKKKLEEGKKIATAAFHSALDKGSEVADSVGKKASELNSAVEAGASKVLNKVEAKVSALRKKKQDGDTPKNG